MSQHKNTDSYEPIDLGNDLAPKEIPVKGGGKNYVLREASAGAVVQYRNAVTRSIKMKDGKPDSVGDLANAEPLLVSLCLFELKEVKGQIIPIPVPETTIRSWGARAMKTLFDRIKEISDIDMEGEETPETLEEKISQLQERLQLMRNGRHPESTSKKEPTPTTVTSD
jgi:hypothetical protein